MSAPGGELAAAIEALYAAFARHPLDPPVEGCHCCVDEADARALAAAPVRALEPELVRRYAWSAVNLWGTPDQLKVLFPRVFEVLARGLAPVEPEVALGKLRYAAWEAWPAEEQAAVRAALMAWWVDTLGTFPATRDVEEVLCAIANATDAVEPFLARFLDLEDPDAPGLAPALAVPEGARSGLEPALAAPVDGYRVAALRNLAEFVQTATPGPMARPFLRNAFWSSEGTRRVVAWLGSEPVTRAVERAFLANFEEPWADELALCHGWLDGLRG